MNATTEVQGYVRSIGDFLCVRGSGPPVENVDRPAPADVKQDAALRAVVGLRRLGKAVTADAAASFDAEPGMVALAYRWARQDAVRRHFGRSAQTCLRPIYERDTDVSDDRQEDAIEAVETDHAAEVRRLLQQGIPGLSLHQTARVFAVMWEVQELKDRGVPSTPDALRKTVSRLRQETRLPLVTSLL